MSRDVLSPEELIATAVNDLRVLYETRSDMSREIYMRVIALVLQDTKQDQSAHDAYWLQRFATLARLSKLAAEEWVNQE